MNIRLGVTPTGMVCPFNNYGRITANQRADSVCNLSAQATQAVSANISQVLQSAIQQTATQNGAVVQQFLASAVALQFEDIDTETELVNSLVTNVTTAEASSCVANSINTEAQTLYFCGNNYSDLTFNQESHVQSIALCVTNQIYGLFDTGGVYNRVLQDADQKLAAQQQGLASILWPLAIAAVIGGIIFLYFFFGSGRRAQSSAGPRTAVIVERPPPSSAAPRAAVVGNRPAAPSAAASGNAGVVARPTPPPPANGARRR